MREPDIRPVALVVNSRRSIRTSRLELLQSVGFEAVGAGTPAEALGYFDSHEVNIAILEIDLDDHDPYDSSGVVLARAMRRKDTGLPIVGVSGAVDTIPAEQRDAFTECYFKGTVSFRMMVRNVVD